MYGNQGRPPNLYQSPADIRAWSGGAGMVSRTPSVSTPMPVTPSTSRLSTETAVSSIVTGPTVSDVYKGVLRTASECPFSEGDASCASVLRQCVAALACQVGFETSKPNVIETLAYMAELYLTTLCDVTRLVTEAAGRTQPTPTDVHVALADHGVDITTLPPFLDQLLRHGSIIILPPKQGQTPPIQSPMRVGLARGRQPPPHAATPYLPPFPDPHTYIRTEISAEPDMSYERVREIAAEKKRAGESSLVEFMLRTEPSTCLFPVYERRLKELARETELDRVRRRQARREQKRKERSEKRMREALKDGDLPEDVVADEEEATVDEDVVEDDEDELPEDPDDHPPPRVPFWCMVLKPTPEARPYLASLCAEEEDEDETAQGAASPRRGVKRPRPSTVGPGAAPTNNAEVRHLQNGDL